MRRFFILFAIASLFFTSLPLTAAMNQNTVKKIVIIKEKEDGYTFGIVVKNPDKATLQKLKLNGGAEVVAVNEGSAAEKAGLKPHDIIVKFDGQAVNDPEDLADIIDAIDEQKKVDVVVYRGDGKELILTATVKPEDREDENEMYGFHWPSKAFGRMMDSLPDFNAQIWPFLQSLNEKGGYLGVVVDNLNDQLLKYFKADYGVLIKKVFKNSPAEKADLKAGDVIYKINDKKIEDAADLVRTVQYYDPGDKITVYFIRNGKKKSVDVMLAKKEGQEGWHSIFPGFWLNPERWHRQHFRRPFTPPQMPRFHRIPQERRRGIYKF